MTTPPVSTIRQAKPGGTVVLTTAWILLLLFCLLSYYLAEGRLSGKTLALVVFATALLKLGMVAAFFMELWSSGRPYLYIALGLCATTLGLMATVW